MGELPDCQACGACCVEAGAVTVEQTDATPRHYTRSVRRRIGYASWEADEGRREMAKHIGGRCKALRGVVGRDCRCATYDRRPAVCRQFERGSEGCLASRERMAWKLSRAEWGPHGYGEEWAKGVPPDYRPKATGPHPSPLPARIGFFVIQG